MISRLFSEYKKNPTSSYTSYDESFFSDMIVVLFTTILIDLPILITMLLLYITIKLAELLSIEGSFLL